MTWFLSNKLCENLRSLQERAAESLEENSLDGAPSVPLKSSLTVVKFSCGGRTKATLNLSPSGMTCELLTDALGMDLWMSSVVDSPAKTSALQGRARASMASEADSGKSLRASLAKYDPVSRSWKIARHLFGEDLAQSSETWPRWGMTQGGELYPLPIAAEFICESGSGLSLPTPRSCTAMQAQITESTANAEFPNLETVLARLMLPTIGKNEGSASARFTGSRDFRGAKMSEGLRTCKTDPIYLNPLFAELVMMWPSGWTDLQPLATAKCQSAQLSRGQSFQEWFDKFRSMLETV